MDLGNLFNSLEDYYKDITLAGAIGFPIAYLDCWKLHPSFRGYDITSQLILSLGVDLIFVGIGLTFCIWIWRASKHNPVRPAVPEFNAIMLLLIFVLTSTFVLTGTIKEPMYFEFCYMGFYILYIAFQLIIDIFNGKKKERGSGEDKEHNLEK